jgi:large subunit ribosomal protein L5
MSVETKYIPRLYQKYRDEVVPKLVARFGYKNPMEVPKLVKIVVNMGVGEAVKDIKNLERAMEDLRTITGQQPAVRRAKKSEAGFYKGAQGKEQGGG